MIVDINGGPTFRIVKRKKKSSRNFSGQISNSVRNYYSRQCALLRGELPENPVKNYRLTRNLTIAQLAQMVGLSEHALIRTEQGFFPNVSARLAREIGGDINDRYNEWQTTSRRQHYRLFGDLGRIKFRSDKHPLDQLYEQWSVTDTDEKGKCYYTPVGTPLNDTEVCKLLCLNQSVINYWHNKPNVQKTIPTQVLEALATNGYTKTELALLAAAYSEHQKYLRTGQVQTTTTWDEFKEELKEEIQSEVFKEVMYGE